MKKQTLFFIFSLVLLICFFPKSVSGDDTTSSAHVTYDLAYPGMLPDNPFYKLKVARDKVIIFLISDPSKKIDYYLLQADKGILATAMLFDKKEIPLAQTTALKAENNFTLLNFEIPNLQRKPEEKFFKKLEDASMKHQEVLSLIINKLRPEQQKIFNIVLQFSKTNLERLEKYHNKDPKRWKMAD